MSGQDSRPATRPGHGAALLTVARGVLAGRRMGGTTGGLLWARTQNPRILGPLYRLVADRCDDLELPGSRMLDVCGRCVLSGCH
jgi:hypothetical protein